MLCCGKCGSTDIKDNGVTNPEPWWMIPQWREDIKEYKARREHEKSRITRMGKALSVAIPGNSRDPAIRERKLEVLYLRDFYLDNVFGKGGRKPCSAKYDLDQYPWRQDITFRAYWKSRKPIWWHDEWIPEGFWADWEEPD